MRAAAGVLGTVAEAAHQLGSAFGPATIAGARLVLVGLDVGERREWAALLTRAGAHVEVVTGLGALRALPAWRDTDLLLAATAQPDGSLASLLADERLPFILIADTDGQAELSALLPAGPADVWLRPVLPAHVVSGCTAALTRIRPRTPRAAAGRARTQAARLPELGSAGAAIARTRLPVLVLGETGTGKSRLARMLHETLLPHAPFVEVNAASLHGPLFSSELFGHERGAFTGALAAKPGLVAKAHGGTIFLDEIGDLSGDGQAQLLTYLDTGTYRTVGGVHEVRSDARVFCATNRDLGAQVAAGRFREDLYYRLASIVVSLPALRSHREGIPALAQELLLQLAERDGTPPPRLTPDAVRALGAYDWPGNVRQLRFVMERLMALAPGAPVGAQDLAPLLGATLARAGASPTQVRPLAQMEEELVQLAMRQARGNRAKAAELLGITTRGLYNKLRRGGRTFQESE